MAMKSVNRFQTRVRSQFNQNLTNSGINLPAGIYLGEVTQNVDPDYPNTNPRIKVHIFSLFPSIYPQNQGSTTTGEPELGSIWCQRILPFGGITAQGGDTATSFGVLGPPPDVGNTVIVGYTGDYASGIILGVLPDLQKQESVTTGGPSSVNNEGIGPSFEPTRTGDRTARPIVSGSAEDLLQDDTLRGRPRPNGFNMGMSDRTGNTLTLSPGDSEDGTGGGVRLRTAQGSQIMMDDRTGNIYINNRSGTGWMELNNNGDFDVYCQGTFSVRAVGGFNFHTDNNFSAQADESINLKSLGGGGVKIQAAGGNIDMDSLNDLKITAQGGELHVNTGGNILLTSRAQIHLNGPTAERADPPIVANQLGNTGVTESISGRVPEQEPWRGHADFSPDADAFSGSGGTGGNYSTYGGNGVDPSRVGNQYASLTQTPSDWVFWQDGVDGRINPELFSAIENIARGYGKAFEITKGYIEPSRAGGTSPADNSMHMTGDAVDIVHAQGSPEMTIAMIETIIELAKENGIGGIGVYNGRRPDAPFANKLHFDLGRERIWGECDNGSLQYECLPDAIQDYAEKQGYDPEIPSNDTSFNVDNAPVDAPPLPPELANDPEFMAAIDQLLEDHPEMSREELYSIMYGESTYNPTLIAQANGLYGGLFQQGGTKQEAQYISGLSAAQQVGLYNQYLTENNYSGGGLGMYQAAPGVVQNYSSANGTPPPNNVVLYIPSNYSQEYVNNLESMGYDTRYASRQFGTAVLSQNSAGSRTEIRPGTGWLDKNGVITVGSVNSYYNEK